MESNEMVELQRDVDAAAFRRKAGFLAALRSTNLRRCVRWHGPSGVHSWSVSDWAVAMAGEAGEVCNTVKKLNRLRDNLANAATPDSGFPLELEETIAKIGEEIADTVIYLDLLAAKLGLHMEEEIVRKFNAVSERYGFPERIEHEGRIA